MPSELLRFAGYALTEEKEYIDRNMVKRGGWIEIPKI